MGTEATFEEMGEFARVRLGVIADIHLAPPGTPPTSWHGPIDGAQMRRVLAEARAVLRCESVDAVVLVGDLTEQGDRESLDVVLGDCATLKRQIFVVAGNHDLSVSDDALAGACAERFSPAELLTARGRLLRHGLRIAGQPLVSTPHEISAAEMPEHEGWDGEVVIWVTHYPALSRRRRAEDAGALYAGDLAESTLVASTLASRPAPTIVLHGHLHFRDAASNAGVLQIGLPALAEIPHEVAVIDVVRDAELVVSTRGFALERSAPVAERAPAFAPLESSWRYGERRWRRGRRREPAGVNSELAAT